MREQTNLFGHDMRVLEVGPAPAFATLFSRRDDLNYISIGTNRDMPNQSVVGDVKDLPFNDGSFDAVICQHVLEHVDDDRRSLAEIRRVVSKDGWALISVPIDLDEKTEEDTSITDPEEQKKRFGEVGHLRMYGGDLRDRLHEAGFEVSLHCADELDEETCARHGLRKDEHLFHCTRRADQSAVGPSASD